MISLRGGLVEALMWGACRKGGVMEVMLGREKGQRFVEKIKDQY